MKGIVIREEEKYFTFLGEIFALIGNIQKRYNWLILKYECYPQTKEYQKKLSGTHCWLTGDELSEMIEIEDFQWIWGIFLAFPKKIDKEEALRLDSLDEQDSYEKIWCNPVSVRHPLAEIEIVAWDSSMTVFISKDEQIIERLRRNIPSSEDLEIYNSV